MQASSSTLRREKLERGAQYIKGLALEERAASLAAICARLAQQISEPNIQRELATSSGLSEAMVSRCARDTLFPGCEKANWLAIAQQNCPYTSPYRSVNCTGVILAGNVFTAALKACCIPLLLGSAVVAKVSSRDKRFAQLLHTTMVQFDPTFAEAFELVFFEGGDVFSEAALIQDADLLSVYGSDQTLADIRTRNPDLLMLEHGHGFGAIYISADALQNQNQLDSLIHKTALDVALYDQRGCLSPQAIWIEQGSALSAAVFATHLATIGLEALQKTLPRGELSLAALAQQMMWRAVGAATGTLLENEHYAVSYENNHGFRASPGYRNIAVLDADSPQQWLEQVAPFQQSLKIVGFAGSESAKNHFAQVVSPAPLLVEVGQMQTPSWQAFWD